MNVPMHLRALGLLTLLACLHVVARAQPPLDQAPRGLPLGPWTDIASTAVGSDAPADGWQRHDQASINLGFSRREWWLRSEFVADEAVAAGDIEWFYDLGTANLRSVEFWHHVDGELVSHSLTGMALPFTSREVPYRKFTFRIDRRPGTHRILVRLTSRGPIALRPMLATRIHWFGQVSGDRLLTGALFGVLIMLMFYNTSLLVVTREPVFGLLALALGGALAYRLWDSGLALQYLFPETPFWGDHIGRAGVSLYMGALGLLTREYLRVNTWSPLLARVLLIYGMATAALGVLPLLQDAPELGMLILAGTPVLCTLASVLAVHQRRPGARAYALAVSLVVVGILVTIGRSQGWLPFMPWTEHIGVITAVGLGLLTSVGLGGRLAEEKSAKVDAEQAAEAQGRFLANMSHEIRTPLNAVIGFAELLRDSRLNEGQQAFLARIDTASRNLLGIVNDVLDYSKLAVGETRLESAPLRLRGLIAEVTSLFDAEVDRKGLALKVDIDANVPSELLGDSMRLTQVLTNLLGNAVKFTAEGGVRVGARWDDATRRLQIEVQDTGIGLSEQQLQRLFTPFGQADDSTTRRFGGTGLGLAICRELIELMDGSIEVRSALGRGSTFTLTLPLQPASRTPEESTTPAPAVLRSTGHGPRVLVVEDNDTNRVLVRAMLSRQGIEPVLAENGEEALARLAEQRYDVVLMDCQMPLMDGYEATRRIRQDPGLRHLRIIALTANALEGDQEACLDAGMDDYLSKPVRLGDLAGMLKRWGMDDANTAEPTATVAVQA